MAPLEYGMNLEAMRETPQSTMGSEATMPITQSVRRSGAGRNTSSCASVQTATAIVAYGDTRTRVRLMDARPGRERRSLRCVS